MKQVTIVIPEGKATLSTITGSLDILNSANAYWQRMGNSPMIGVCLAGFMTELKLGGGYFSVHPSNIMEISKTDLVIIPAVVYHDKLATERR
jgi:hypothetical protein